jgi:Mor family transcriptional regulator
MDKTIQEASTTSVLTQLIGREATARIVQHFGGEILYVPKRIKDGRDDEIKREFSLMLESGTTCMNSYKTIARKYELSPRRIMAIVNG